MRTSRKQRAAPIRITPAAASGLASGRPGLYLIEHRHDPGCPAAVTQRGDDCRCDPDTRIVSYADLEKEGRLR
jgi:hypothetical protein